MFQKLLRWLRAQIGTLFGDAPGANDIILSGQMENALALWAQMYETGGPWCTAKTTCTVCISQPAWRGSSPGWSRWS